jgi:hypothetical protein
MPAGCNIWNWKYGFEYLESPIIQTSWKVPKVGGCKIARCMGCRNRPAKNFVWALIKRSWLYGNPKKSQQGPEVAREDIVKEMVSCYYK